MEKEHFSSLALVAVILASSGALGGCTVIGDIFKAGVWAGVLMVVAALALIGGGAFALSRRGT